MSFKWVKLSDVCERITDGSHFSPKTVDEGFPYITVRDIDKDNINFESCKFVTKEDFSELSKNGCSPKLNDLLFSKDGTVGKVALVSNDVDFVVLSSLAILTPKLNIINPSFLFYVLKSPDFVNTAIGKKTGVAIRRIILKNLKEISIPLPSLLIQKKIVAKLDAIFAEIDKATAAAEANAKNAEILFQSYLSEIFEGKEENRVQKSLLELANEDCSLSYGIVQPGDDFQNGLPIVRPTNLTKKYIPKLELKTINPILAESYKRTTLTGEELLLCVRGTTGTVSISTEELKGCNVTRGIVPIRFKKNLIDLDYAYYLFNSSVLQKQIKSKTYGAALLQINIADVKKLKIPVPKIEEQKKIVIQLDSVKSYIDILKNSQQKKKQFLIDYKQSILTQAFNGDLVKE